MGKASVTLVFDRAIECPSPRVRTMSTIVDSEGTLHVAAVMVHLCPLPSLSSRC